MVNKVQTKPTLLEIDAIEDGKVCEKIAIVCSKFENTIERSSTVHACKRRKLDNKNDTTAAIGPDVVVESTSFTSGDSSSKTSSKLLPNVCIKSVEKNGKGDVLVREISYWPGQDYLEIIPNINEDKCKQYSTKNDTKYLGKLATK